MAAAPVVIERPSTGISRSRRLGANARPLLAFLLLLSRSANGADAVQSQPISPAAVHAYAISFLQEQESDGSYRVGPKVQSHLKAEIAMALAAEALAYPAYAASAAEDLDWVIDNRLESSGGLNWDGPSNPYFFECHQHWFLIASELLRRQGAVGQSVATIQVDAWRFLLGTNPATGDFYRDNQLRYGPFFAYRSVDRSGFFQTQAAFKGSYEIGAALWSMALIQDLDWMNDLVVGGNTVHVSAYLDESVGQAAFVPQGLGWYDPYVGRWIRSILWTSLGWDGWEEPDWKYGLHLEEGALEAYLRSGDERLDEPCRRFLETLIGLILSDGTIATLPDRFGTARYEYGEALSVLGLGAEVFQTIDPELSRACIAGAGQVTKYVLETFPPICSEDGAMLLAGLSRSYRAQTLAELAENGQQAPPPSLSLLAWPNPAAGRLTVSLSGPVQAGTRLWLADATGRRVRSISIGDPEERVVQWTLSDGVGRSLPSGRYWLIAASGTARKSTGITILR